jgi:hypothetical protein
MILVVAVAVGCACLVIGLVVGQSASTARRRITRLVRERDRAEAMITTIASSEAAWYRAFQQERTEHDRTKLLLSSELRKDVHL